MELLSAFGSDIEKSTDGVWITISDVEGEQGRLKIARMWTPRFKEAFRKYTEGIKNISGVEPNDQEEADIMAKCFAETILLDWENIVVNGKAYLYSTDNAYKLLSMPELRDFRDKIATEASKFSNYRLENLETTTGKS